MTVRRDLDVLDDAGLVVKVHGGATRPLRAQHRRARLRGQVAAQHVEKRAIAASAAVLVGAGAAIGHHRRHDHRAARRRARHRPRPDGRDQQHPGRRRAPRRRPARSHGDPRSAVNARRATRSSGRSPSAALARVPPRHRVHGRARHARAGRLHHAEPAWRPTPTAPSSTPPTQLVVLADHTKWGVTGLCTIAALTRRRCVVSDDGARCRRPLRSSANASAG